MRKLIFAILIAPILAITGLVATGTSAVAEDDGHYGDYRFIRDVSWGFHYTNIRDGASSQNHCSVYMVNDTSIAKKYGAYLRVKGNINDWLYFSGSLIVSPDDVVRWDVPGDAIIDSLEPFIRISQYTFSDNEWVRGNDVTIDAYDPPPGQVTDYMGPLGSQDASTGFTDC